MIQITLTKEVLKEQVKIIREFLKKNDYTLSQSATYNLLALMYGIKDWNTLVAAINEGN